MEWLAWLLGGFPLALTPVMFALPSNRPRPWLLPLGGAVQLALAVRAIFPADGDEMVRALNDWLLLDALGKVVLGLICVLFFICSLYAPVYLALRGDRPNRVLCGNLFASLA